MNGKNTLRRGQNAKKPAKTNPAQQANNRPRRTVIPPSQFPGALGGRIPQGKKLDSLTTFEQGDTRCTLGSLSDATQKTGVAVIERLGSVADVEAAIRDLASVVHSNTTLLSSRAFQYISWFTGLRPVNKELAKLSHICTITLGSMLRKPLFKLKVI